MAQLGGIIALQAPVSDGKGTFFFGGVDGVKWRKPVVPGDVLVMEVSLFAYYIARIPSYPILQEYIAHWTLLRDAQ
jgi:3-hydroxymyristoyl/3-hydroxydecanoyl-(acyl carrier protein) dehydratase